MHLLQELHLYEDRAPESAAMNMAVDEALLECATAPSLRFYRWQRPSLSFGYFGAFAEVVEEAAHREVVRRWTGGGIVLHGSDLTYSLILPSRTRELPAARIIYLEVHEAIRRALSPHIAVELASNDAPRSSGSCFANPVTTDVLAGGRKIAGAAQRRTRAGLLHQGSIQDTALPAAFAEAFAGELCPNFTRKQFPPQLRQRAQDLAAEKYATAAWLQQR